MDTPAPHTSQTSARSRRRRDSLTAYPTEMAAPIVIVTSSTIWVVCGMTALRGTVGSFTGYLPVGRRRAHGICDLDTDTPRLNSQCAAHQVRGRVALM